MMMMVTMMKAIARTDGRRTRTLRPQIDQVPASRPAPSESIYAALNYALYIMAGTFSCYLSRPVASASSPLFASFSVGKTKLEIG